MTGSTVQRPWLRTLLGAVLAVAYLIPVYWMTATSLKREADVFASPPSLIPAPPTLAAYRGTVVDDTDVWQGLFSSTIITVPALLLTLLLAAPAAYALAKFSLRATGVVLFVLLAAQMLPSISVALPMFAIYSEWGLIDTYVGLIIANTSITLPFAIVLLRPYMLGIPSDLLDAARIDGCTEWGAFRRVGLPLVKPGLIMVATLTFVTVWGEFVFGLTLATSDARQPVTVVLNRFVANFGTQWTNLMTVSVVLVVPIVVIFVALQRHVVAGITEGAIKD